MDEKRFLEIRKKALEICNRAVDLLPVETPDDHSLLMMAVAGTLLGIGYTVELNTHGYRHAKEWVNAALGIAQDISNAHGGNIRLSVSSFFRSNTK
jgi:hypothetical protein